jgi:hypothetical protein
MKSVKAILAGFAVFCQLLFVGALILRYETILRTGKEVVLRVIAVDEQEFNAERYRPEFESAYVARELCTGDLANYDPMDESMPRPTKLYLSFKTPAEGPSVLHAASLVPLSEGTLMKARPDFWWTKGGTVLTGLERPFSSQNEKKIVHDEMFRDGFRREWDVVAAVGMTGFPIMKNHRFSSVAFKFAIVEKPKPGIEVTVRNVSDKETAVLDWPGGASFDVLVNEQKGWRQTKMKPVRLILPGKSEIDKIVKKIKAGGEYQFRIPFEEFVWKIADEDGRLRNFNEISMDQRPPLIIYYNPIVVFEDIPELWKGRSRLGNI